MPMGRPKPPLALSLEESERLRAIAASRTLPHGLVRRARIILLSASGMSNQAIAARLHLNPVTVGHWRSFLEQGLSGLHGELRPGRPRSISDEPLAALIRKTLRAGPHGPHWSCRSLAVQTRLSKSTIHRIWRAFGLQPHRQRHFQLSNDPFFVEKVRDIVGLYVHPPVLVAKIGHFVRTYNAQASPFAWTATADSILEKIRRLCEHISGTRH